jgi:hypothetical protein
MLKKESYLGKKCDELGQIQFVNAALQKKIFLWRTAINVKQNMTDFVDNLENNIRSLKMKIALNVGKSGLVNIYTSLLGVTSALMQINEDGEQRKKQMLNLGLASIIKKLAMNAAKKKRKTISMILCANYAEAKQTRTIGF